MAAKTRDGIEWSAALRCLRGLGARPGDPELFIQLHHAFGGSYNPWLLERLERDTHGREVLSGRSGGIVDSVDLEGLRTLPRGTTGREYLEFLEECGISPAELVRIASTTIPRSQDPRAHRVNLRLHAMHDVWHLVAGYGCDVVGEAGLLIFSFEQTRNRAYLWLAGIVAFTAIAWGRPDVLRLMWQARQRGRSAPELFSLDWSTRWEEPLENVRAELNLTPLPEYQPLPDVLVRQGWFTWMWKTIRGKNQPGQDAGSEPESIP